MLQSHDFYVFIETSGETRKTWGFIKSFVCWNFAALIHFELRKYFYPREQDCSESCEWKWWLQLLLLNEEKAEASQTKNLFLGTHGLPRSWHFGMRSNELRRKHDYRKSFSLFFKTQRAQSLFTQQLRRWANVLVQKMRVFSVWRSNCPPKNCRLPRFLPWCRLFPKIFF